MRKVNIDTDLRLASTATIRKFMAENKSEFDPRKYLGKTVDAMKRFALIGTKHLDAVVTQQRLNLYSFDMTDRYNSGELDPIVK